jgi:hypothetical protein
MKVRIKHSYTLCVVGLLAAIAPGAYSLKAQQVVDSPRTVTLLTQVKHDDFTTAAVNFALGVRGDSREPLTRNQYDLRYGGRSENGDMDWFDVPRFQFCLRVSHLTTSA